VFALDLLLPILSGGADGDLAVGNIDRGIHRLREGRPFLYVVVGDELEVTALREDRGFIIDRAILETEEQAGGNPIAVDHLEEVADCKYLTLFRTQCEKAVDGPLDVAHGYGLGRGSRLQGTD
jgi:hypothetical protein